MTRQEHNREASSQATCNWVEVRNQAAIAAMAKIIGGRDESFTWKSELNLYEKTAKVAVDYADELVRQLKGE